MILRQGQGNFRASPDQYALPRQSGAHCLHRGQGQEVAVEAALMMISVMISGYATALFHARQIRVLTAVNNTEGISVTGMDLLALL
jgi:hypothetical protein